MSEQDAPQSIEPVVADAPQSLDDVISDFNVPDAPQAAPNNVAEFKPAQSQRIDAYDEEGLNKWASDVNNNLAALQSENQSLKADAKAVSDAAAQAATDAKIQGAVKVIADGIPGLDPLAAEFILEKAARDNDKFAHLFHNQDKDPALYKEALSAIIAENDGKFQRVDNQIAENHRAATQSTQSNATQSKAEYGNSMEEALANASNEAERNYIWHKFKNGG